MKMPFFVAVATLIAIALSTGAYAQDCSVEQNRVDILCKSVKPSPSCERARDDLAECLNGGDDGGSGGGGETEVPGNYSGTLSSTKIKNKADDCESRTSIPGTVTITANGEKNLIAVFSDNPVQLKGKKSKKGFALKFKQKVGGGAKTEYKLSGSDITPASGQFKYTIQRKKGKKTECSASYQGLFNRL